MTDRNSGPSLGRLTAILIVGIIAPVLDSTIVNVALGTLGRDLHTSVANIQWVVTAYLLALAMAIPLTGWSVARYGAKRMWLSALVVFLAGSAMCGLAWNVGSLIAFRAFQGIGGGLMIPIMQTLLVQAAGGRPLGRLMATVSMPALVGPILGPVVGGLIVGHESWRWIFYVNAPVCLIALALAWWGLPADRTAADRTAPNRTGSDRAAPNRAPRTGYRLDVVGLALISPGLAAGIFGLSQVASGGRPGFSRLIAPQVTVPLAVFVALMAAFIAHTLRTRAVPVVDLRLFAVRSFRAASALLFLSGLSLYGAMLLLPLYYQQVRGASVVAAGVALAPQGLGSLLTRSWLGRLTDRLGARPVILVCVLVTLAGTVPFAFAGAHTNQWALGAALVVRGAGLGGVMLAVMTAAFDGLRRDQVPHASSATRIAQQVGGSFGAAVLAVILQHQLGGGADAVAAYRDGFWWATGFTVIALIPALFLPGARRPAPETPDESVPVGSVPARSAAGGPAPDRADGLVARPIDAARTPGPGGRPRGPWTASGLPGRARWRRWERRARDF
ncbi:MDR family MFS transporter [Rugosimonospora acidiphila]|uniref:MDR family MFS transporter n=1 Tax=Rugosimonospora acidiphila TaxID=556531 RepID=A0ABP9RXT1_9ACTN